jgi:hypothetical protein
LKTAVKFNAQAQIQKLFETPLQTAAASRRNARVVPPTPPPPASFCGAERGLAFFFFDSWRWRPDHDWQIKENRVLVHSNPT